MTRENKVALVVGFALVLFVGILISDHLSEAQTRRSADLVPVRNDRPADIDRGPEIIDLQNTDRRTQEPAAPAPTPAMNEPPVAATPGPVAPPAARVHEVQAGEALSVICYRHYGDPGLVDELAEHNGLDDPDMLRAGFRLRLPPIEKLAGPVVLQDPRSPGLPAAGETPPPPPRSDRTYRIMPGDSLSQIAGRLLDSAARWRELYELNRDLLDDPDDIEAGTVIRLPGLK